MGSRNRDVKWADGLMSSVGQITTPYKGGILPNGQEGYGGVAQRKAQRELREPTWGRRGRKGALTSFPSHIWGHRSHWGAIEKVVEGGPTPWEHGDPHTVIWIRLGWLTPTKGYSFCAQWSWNKGLFVSQFTCFSSRRFRSKRTFELLIGSVNETATPLKVDSIMPSRMSSSPSIITYILPGVCFSMLFLQPLNYIFF